jgi:hypothetical protein
MVPYLRAANVSDGRLNLGDVCFQNILLRIRPRSEQTDPRLLAWWCRATQIADVKVGLAQRVIMLKPDLSLVLPDSLAFAVRSRHSTRTLNRQLALLKERRQALISAAVTGELDVTARMAGL